eukprot:366476-Chlamydomonas_euryale.AAC.2
MAGTASQAAAWTSLSSPTTCCSTAFLCQQVFHEDPPPCMASAPRGPSLWVVVVERDGYAGLCHASLALFVHQLLQVGGPDLQNGITDCRKCRGAKSCHVPLHVCFSACQLRSGGLPVHVSCAVHLICSADARNAYAMLAFQPWINYPALHAIHDG